MLSCRRRPCGDRRGRRDPRQTADGDVVVGVHVPPSRERCRSIPICTRSIERRDRRRLRRPTPALRQLPLRLPFLLDLVHCLPEQKHRVELLGGLLELHVKSVHDAFLSTNLAVEANNVVVAVPQPFLQLVQRCHVLLPLVLESVDLFVLVCYRHGQPLAVPGQGHDAPLEAVLLGLDLGEVVPNAREFLVQHCRATHLRGDLVVERFAHRLEGLASRVVLPHLPLELLLQVVGALPDSVTLSQEFQHVVRGLLFLPLRTVDGVRELGLQVRDAPVALRLAEDGEDAWRYVVLGVRQVRRRVATQRAAWGRRHNLVRGARAGAPSSIRGAGARADSRGGHCVVHGRVDDVCCCRHRCRRVVKVVASLGPPGRG
eukprot:PhM_4_TR16483/c0_g1_i1/m.77320